MLKSRFSLRSLRVSLKFRPEIMRLILKMRHIIRKKTELLNIFKQQLMKQNSPQATNTSTQTENNTANIVVSKIPVSYKEQESTDNNQNTKLQTAFTQTDEITSNLPNTSLIPSVTNTHPNEEKETSNLESTKEQNGPSYENGGWKLSSENNENVKSIAEQVKKAAQSAMQQSGMVYIESAGMYYDYKTGYYYSSKFGLYYHPDTGCYYHYSEDKQTFEFHSYPDRSKTATNALYEADEKKKARKLRKARQREEKYIEDLKKLLSQEKEDDQGSKAKRRKKSNKNTESAEDEQTEKSIGSDSEQKIVEKVQAPAYGETVFDEAYMEVKNQDLEEGECSESDSGKGDDYKHINTFTEEADDSIKLYLRKKVEQYMKRAETIKKLVLQQKETGKFHEQVLIENNSTGHSYKSLFGRFLDDNVQYVVVEDPYIRNFHQCQNLLRLCELLVKTCRNLSHITLVTSRGSKSEGDQRNWFHSLNEDLHKYRVNLVVEYSETLHDRQITLSSGWIIKIGRGLDFFKPPENKFCLGVYDLDLRQCHETTVDIVHSKNVKQSYG